MNEENVIMLIGFILSKTRLGVPDDDIRHRMVEHGVDEALLKSITAAFAFVTSQMGLGIAQADIKQSMIQHGISARLVQYMVDELSVNSDRAFLQHLHGRVFQDLRNRVDGTEREKRFPSGRKDSVDAQEYAATLDWVTHHSTPLFQAWSRLADPASKSLFIDLLRFHISGSEHVCLSLDPNWSAYNKMVAEISIDRVAQQRHPEFQTGGFRCWQFPVQERTIHLLCFFVSIYHAFYMDQYFFKRGHVRIQPEEGDYAVDTGGFVGETAVRFAIAVGRTGRVYSFEPVQENVTIFEQNLSTNGLDNIIIFPYGLSNVNHEAPLVSGGSITSGFRSDDAHQEIPLIMLDKLVQDGTVERVDFLKMDIEGAELDALKGAEQTIRHFKPKLAISAYHNKNNDLYSISDWIAGLDLGYYFFLDAYHYDGRETVLFATTTPPF